MKLMAMTIFLGVIAFLPGCRTKAARSTAEPTTKMIGKVTLDDVPLTVGEVNCLSEDGRQLAIGGISEAGDFVVLDPPVGKTKIYLSFTGFSGEDGFSVDPKGKYPSRIPKKLPPRDLGGPDLPELEKMVPVAYRYPDTSGLWYSVVPGENKIDIKLTKDKR